MFIYAILLCILGSVSTAAQFPHDPTLRTQGIIATSGAAATFTTQMVRRRLLDASPDERVEVIKDVFAPAEIVGASQSSDTNTVRLTTTSAYTFSVDQVLLIPEFKTFTIECNNATISFEGAGPFIELGTNSTLILRDCNTVALEADKELAEERPALQMPEQPQAQLQAEPAPLEPVLGTSKPEPPRSGGPVNPDQGGPRLAGNQPKLRGPLATNTSILPLQTETGIEGSVGGGMPPRLGGGRRPLFVPWPGMLGVVEPGKYSGLASIGGSYETSCVAVKYYASLAKNAPPGSRGFTVKYNITQQPRTGDQSTTLLVSEVTIPFAPPPRGLFATFSQEDLTVFCRDEDAVPIKVDSKSLPVLAIAGVAIGGIILLCLTALVCFVLQKRRVKKRKDGESAMELEELNGKNGLITSKGTLVSEGESSTGLNSGGRILGLTSMPNTSNSWSQDGQAVRMDPSKLSTNPTASRSGSDQPSSSQRPNVYSYNSSLGEQNDYFPPDASVAVDERIARAAKQLQRELQGEQLQIEKAIGEGGFGTVYKGLWRNIPVAVKTVMFQENGRRTKASRIIAEAAIAYNLQHPNVVATYAHEVKPVGERDSCEHEAWKMYLVQEFCNGGTLRALVDDGGFLSGVRTGSDGVMVAALNAGERWMRVYTVMLSIAEGMAYVHSKSIVHGDLNPSNVLIKVDGGSETQFAPRQISSGAASIKITDFGMSIRLNECASHQSNVRQGTPFYAAPELTSHYHLHKGSDVFSYGVILWEVMNGCAPYVVQKVPGVYGTRFTQHPNYLHFGPTTPLTYTLLTKACLSAKPRERPTFEQIVMVLRDMHAEVGSGVYVGSKGEVHGSRQLDQVFVGPTSSQCPSIDEDTAIEPTWQYLKTENNFKSCLAVLSVAESPLQSPREAVDECTDLMHSLNSTISFQNAAFVTNSQLSDSDAIDRSNSELGVKK